MTTTGIGAPTGALPPASATPANEAFEPSGDLTSGASDGLLVDEHRTARRVLTTLGGIAAVAGAGLLIARGMGSGAISSLPGLVPGAAAAAVLGGGAVLGSQLLLDPEVQPFAKRVDGSMREAGAAAGEIGGDVGIVPAGDDEWGLLPLEGDVADAKGAGAVSLSNPPIRFAGITSRDGDTWVRNGEQFMNRGSATAIDPKTIDPADPASVRQLVGSKAATVGGGTGAVTLGDPIPGGMPGETRAQVVERLFEAGVDEAALVDTGSGIVAYRAAGSGVARSADDLHARGTEVQPVGAVTLLSDLSKSPTAHSAASIGAPFRSSSVDAPLVDVSKVPIGKAASLEGRRVAGSGGDVQRLGSLLGTDKDFDDAVAAAAKTGNRTLLARLDGGTARYALPGSGAQPLVTALGGDDGDVQVVQGRKRYFVREDGSVRFVARTVPYDVQEPIGSVLDTGSIHGRATKRLGSYQTREDALAAVRGDLGTATPYAIVQSRGPEGYYHAYEIDRSASGPAWDTDLGSTSMGAWRNDHYQKTVHETENHPSTYGTDVYHYDHVTERTVRFLDSGSNISEVATSGSREVSRNLDYIDRAFDPHEAIGHTVRIGGESLRINQWIDSTDWESSARSRIDTSAADGNAYVVLDHENNRGQYHVYSASLGGGGSSWDEGRADVEMASWSVPRSRTYGETERRAGQYGTDVYYYDVTERWRERLLSEGYGSRVTDSTSHSRDRVLDYVDRADPPPPPPTTTPGGGTSHGDDPPYGGGNGNTTSPGDSPSSGSGSSGSSDSTDNGNPSDDDF